jgi:hypothetical protein
MERVNKPGFDGFEFLFSFTPFKEVAKQLVESEVLRRKNTELGHRAEPFSIGVSEAQTPWQKAPEFSSLLEKDNSRENLCIT